MLPVDRKLFQDSFMRFNTYEYYSVFAEKLLSEALSKIYNYSKKGIGYMIYYNLYLNLIYPL